MKYMLLTYCILTIAVLQQNLVIGSMLFIPIGYLLINLVAVFYEVLRGGLK